MNAEGDNLTMHWLESVWLDLRFGARALRKSPAFAIVALLSLALGIGANAAIFQLLDVVRLRALPVRHPEEIVEVRIAPGSGGRTGAFLGSRPSLTNPLWEMIRDRQTSLQDPFVYGAATFELAAGGESRPVQGLFISGNYFHALEARPAAGRLLGPADDVRGCGAPGAVLSHAFWAREFGAAADIDLKTIRVDGATLPIAGVVSSTFAGIDVGRRIDVYLPVCARPLIKKTEPALDKQDVWWLAMFGRLKPGVTIDRATAELASLSLGIFAATVSPRYEAADDKAYRAFQLTAMSAETGVSNLRTRYATSLTLLLSIAGLVFLIACANLANLMLARASTRAREIAVRLAIGASRTRLFRQLIAESLLLAGVGAAAGIGLALLLSRALVAILTSDGSPWALDLAMDWRLIGFAVGLAVVACLLFGLAPAVRATRVAPGAVMHLGGRGLTTDRRRLLVRRVLVVGQVSVSLVLVVGALLFVGTLRNLGQSGLGFSDRGVLVVDLDLRPAGMAPDGLLAYQQGIIERLTGTPGVTAGGGAAITPLGGSGWNESILIDGARQPGHPDANRVSPGYFDALQIGFAAGRNFDARDRRNTTPAVIVNEAFRDTYLAGANPIGRQFRILVGPGQPDLSYEIIGVVKNTKYRDLREPMGPQMYFAAAQEPDPGPFLTVVLHTGGDPNDLRAAVGQTIHDIHPAIVITNTVMETQVRNTLLRERLMATLSSGFAVLAVVLAAVGLYGLMAYGVARRRNEIGIRVALGATRGRIVGMIAREIVWLVGAGVAIGVAGAIYAGRAAEALLYGLTSSSPLMLAAGAGVLTFIALLAGVIPASRAARLDPTSALKDEG
jgi:putative ABC transport system permease protein